MGPMEPFTSTLDLQSGVLDPVGRVLRRPLSDLRDAYADADAVRRILETEGDRLIYEVRLSGVPEAEGQVPHGVTTIFPGRVGEEFHMTKGHFHVKRDRAEIYLGLAGEGRLVLQTDGGAVRALEMRHGTLAYIPPFWAHRSANTGDAPFVFFSAWPGDAGHDYLTIERKGFARLLVARDGQAVLVDNPRHA